MTVGTALRTARRKQGMSAEALAEYVPYSREMIQKIERGERKIAKDMRGTLGRQLDDPTLYLALAHEATGGVMCSPLLNAVEKHRLVLKDLFLIELAEAEHHTREAQRLFLKPVLTDEEKDRATEVCLEILEALTAGENLVVALAKEHGIKLSDLWDEHENRLVEAGYLKKEAPAK